MTMPGPTTEVLNDDIKELRDDLHKVETSLRDEIHRVEISLRGDLNRVETSLTTGLAELRAEVRVSLGVVKWVGAFIVTTVLTGGISAAIAGVWWASNITAEVKHLADVVEGGKAAPRPAAAPR
jgi:hypothetical protein